jgi:hypothetical protein
MLQQMGLLMLLAATISAAASSQAEMRTQGNSTNVKIEMNFDTPTKTQSMQAVISQLSSSAFQIVVADEHQACQLARIINSDLSPCFHEQREENEPEGTDAVVFSHNITSKQRKTAQSALWLPKKHTSISALSDPHSDPRQRKENEPEGTDAVVFFHNITSKQRKTAQSAHWLPKKHTSISALHSPPHVLLQASQDFPDHHPYMVSETSNNTPKDPEGVLKKGVVSGIQGAIVGQVPNTAGAVRRRLVEEVSDWAAMKTACGSSGTVALSNSFVIGTYTPTPSPQYGGIDFSGKQLVIIGNNKTLDAGEDG